MSSLIGLTLKFSSIHLNLRMDFHCRGMLQQEGFVPHLQLSGFPIVGATYLDLSKWASPT